MAAYKTLKGQSIRQVAQDPTNPIEGEIWYNTTIGVLKGFPALLAWSSGGSLSTGHQDTMAAGTQTAGLCFGGTPPTGGIVATEEYNGSGWAAGGDMNTARRGAAKFSAATQTAALGFGGNANPPTTISETEEYNGSSWTSGGDLNSGRRYIAGAGLQNAALGFGGGPAAIVLTEMYDGSSWTNTVDMGTP